MHAKIIFSLLLFLISSNHAMENSIKRQTAKHICYIDQIPLEIIAHILCDNVDNFFCIDEFCQQIRNFLVTCKKYYQSNKLTTDIINKIINHYPTLELFPIATALYLNTMSSKKWLHNWFDADKEHKQLGVDYLVDQVRSHNLNKTNKPQILLLHELSIPINSKNQCKETAFARAQRYKNQEMQKFLIDHGAKE